MNYAVFGNSLRRLHLLKNDNWTREEWKNRYSNLDPGEIREGYHLYYNLFNSEEEIPSWILNSVNHSDMQKWNMYV